MRPSLALELHRDSIRKIALSHRVKNARVFGSVLHGDDTEDSDLDLLVEPTAETILITSFNTPASLHATRALQDEF